MTVLLACLSGPKWPLNGLIWSKNGTFGGLFSLSMLAGLSVWCMMNGVLLLISVCAKAVKFTVKAVGPAKRLGL
jgi:hypothetical protein